MQHAAVVLDENDCSPEMTVEPELYSEAGQ